MRLKLQVLKRPKSSLRNWKICLLIVKQLLPQGKVRRWSAIKSSTIFVEGSWGLLCSTPSWRNYTSSVTKEKLKPLVHGLLTLVMNIDILSEVQSVIDDKNRFAKLTNFPIVKNFLFSDFSNIFRVSNAKTGLNLLC